jgi:hypothetical protein
MFVAEGVTWALAHSFTLSSAPPRRMALRDPLRSVDRTRSPVSVSKKRKSFKYSQANPTRRSHESSELLPRPVKTHVKNIFIKLEVDMRMKVVACAAAITCLSRNINGQLSQLQPRSPRLRRPS